ncbi:MAG: hypothetical protein QW478_00185 [Candidatus Micrarchaeaceae archaeon]
MVRIILKNETYNIKDKYGIILNDETIELMIKALNLHLDRFCFYWNILKPEIINYSKNININNEDWIFYFKNIDKREKDSLAYHNTNKNGKIYGNILVQTILDNNGVILYDPQLGTTTIRDSNIETVSASLAHEIMETLADPNACSMWQTFKRVLSVDGKLIPETFKGCTLVASEVVDPVQNNLIIYKIDGKYVTMCDYVLPSWSDEDLNKGPYNFMNTLSSPFQVEKGGYVVTLDEKGNCTYTFGQLFNKWAKKIKRKSIRHRKRKNK